MGPIGVARAHKGGPNGADWPQESAMELASASLGAEGPHGLHKGKVSLDCITGIAVLGVFPWGCAPGIALTGFFSCWIALPWIVLYLDSSPGIALLGSFPRD